MCRPIYIFSLLVTLLVTSCEVERPDDVIAPDKMETLLYDYHLVQAMSSEYASVEYKEKLLFDYVFKKHGVTKEEFEKSMVWYTRYPKHLKKIYANLEEKLQSEVDAMGEVKGVLGEGVSIDVAYLGGDTAELWTSSRMKILSSTPLSSRLAFDFKTPKDSSFVAGDSLSFSFHATFMTGGVKDVKQLAHAGILLEYADGTSVGRGLDISNTGEYSITMGRNHSQRLKSMSGFVYYTDNDTMAKTKLVLNNVSVKRFHKVTKKKEKKK